MDEEKLLRNAAVRRKVAARSATRLGAEVDEYLSRRQRQFRKNVSVVELWREILPVELQKHCRLSGLSEGTVHLEVEPGA